MEQLLVANVCSGEPLDLIPDVPKGETIDENTMRSWGPSQTCSATAIRDILRGRLAADPDPHGLRLRGARISGRLDLESLETDVNLELKDCLLEEGVLARDADLATFSLAGCQLEHRAESPLDADRLTCSMLILSDARIIGHADAGAVRLVGAHIGGQLDCTGASLCNDSGPALLAYGLKVGQDMKLSSGFTATGAGDGAAVDLRGAQVAGALVFDPARLEHATGPRWRLAVDGLTYSGMPEEISAWGWLDLLRDGTPRYAAQPYKQLADGYRARGDERQARSALMAQRDDQLARTYPSWQERYWVGSSRSSSATGTSRGGGCCSPLCCCCLHPSSRSSSARMVRSCKLRTPRHRASRAP